MKKILLFALSLIFAFSFAACGMDNSGTESDMNAKSGNNGTSLESAMDNTGLNGNSGAGKIGSERAKQIALEHAGLSEQQAKNLKIDLDRDNGVLKYEIDFYYGNVEYDYDLNALTGEIISFDKDID